MTDETCRRKVVTKTTFFITASTLNVAAVLLAAAVARIKKQGSTAASA
ncbi:hypothetical protein [Oceanimonas baumannii]|nr:hypothetical protein [Oceanimonas baumannii]